VGFEIMPIICVILAFGVSLDAYAGKVASGRPGSPIFSQSRHFIKKVDTITYSVVTTTTTVDTSSITTTTTDGSVTTTTTTLVLPPDTSTSTTSTSSSTSTTTTTTTIPAGPQPVCDPFGATALAQANGTRADLYYITDPDPSDGIKPAGFTEEFASFVNNGVKSPSTVYLSQINVPSRSFTSGFVAEDGQKLKDGMGNDLIEYFALHIEGELGLQAGDTPGYYQLGLLSDDGSTLELDTGSGFQEVIAMDRTQAAVFRCSKAVNAPKGYSNPGYVGEAYYLDASTRIKFRMKYFQGRRVGIALMFTWRRVSGPTGPFPSISNVPLRRWDTGAILDSAVDDCLLDRGQAYPSAYMEWFINAKMPSEGTRWDDMVLRGWQAVPAGNLFMPSSTFNPCAP
jgi:hypothetical protein